MPNKKSIGAFWERLDRKNKRYYAGVITINGKTIKIKGFINEKGKPEMIIYEN